jgi:ADP-L-glycero-D-manno-heptose 6-epimerase
MLVVTGGAGFIGSALVWELNRLGYSDILVVDHLGQSEKWRNLSGLEFQDYVDKGDFLERIQKGQNFGAKGIFHLGACSSTTELDADYLIVNNYEYSKAIARYSADRKIRLIYASSAATYGDGRFGYSDQDEIQKLSPLNMYGYSKHLFDLWMQREGLLQSAVGIKFFNVWGPNEFHKMDMRSMVAKAFEQIKATGSVSLFQSHHPNYEHGKQMRDFLYIKDATRMVLEFLKHPESCGIFNLGTGTAITWIDLISPIFQALNLETKINFIPMPDEIRSKYQYFTQADMQTFENAGLERFATPLKDAVSDFVLNYLETSSYLDSFGLQKPLDSRSPQD